MVNENLKLIENKKPVETVYELKDEIPSFEEFMKSYENDESLNYDDLGHNDIGNNRGYGPTTYGYEECFTSYKGETYSHTRRFFMIFETEWGVDGQWFFGIPTYRSPKRSIDPMNEEARKFISSISRDDYEMSGIWQDGLMRWKIVLSSPDSAEKLLRYFASGGLKVRGRGNVHHRGAENDLINTIRTALETYRNGGKVWLVGRKF